MRTLLFGIVILLSMVMITACSQDVEDASTEAEVGGQVNAPAGPHGIDGFMGIKWYGGKDALLDNPAYEYSDLGYGVERFEYTGSPRYIEYYGVELDSEKYSFLDGEFYDGEVGGSNPADMEKMHVSLVQDYGRPQREEEGLYVWKSDAGTITLQDMNYRWRMIGASPRSSVNLDY